MTNKKITIIISSILLVFIVFIISILFLINTNKSKSNNDNKSVIVITTNNELSANIVTTTSTNLLTTTIGTIKDSYEGWKTYVNKDYGLSLKYPSEYSISEGEEKISCYAATLEIRNFTSKCTENENVTIKNITIKTGKVHQDIIFTVPTDGSGIGGFCDGNNKTIEFDINNKKYSFDGCVHSDKSISSFPTAVAVDSNNSSYKNMFVSIRAGNNETLEVYLKILKSVIFK